jgi:SAM-dependent methyltransferase
LTTVEDAKQFSGNIGRFSGFADQYDRYRAAPPPALAELVRQYAGPAVPGRVVDLGSGTGLSTRYWADKAKRVVGIEPTLDMRLQAEKVTTAENVSYRAGFSHATGLDVACADLVVCMQALHWMDPRGTFAEARRILRPGGIFVVCDYEWPPTTASWEADAAFDHCFRAGRRLESERGLIRGLRHWEKSGHAARMRESGQFRFVKESAVHHVDRCNAERHLGLLLSQGFIMALLRAGMSEEELGITQLRDVTQRTLGGQPRPMIWHATVLLGVV